jgi:exosortase A
MHVLGKFQLRDLVLPEQWRRPLLTLVVLLAALFAIYADTVAATVAIWFRSDTFAHGMLIIPFSLYMLWTNRYRLEPLVPQMSWWGLVAAVPGVFGWLVGNAVNVLVIQQLALLWLIWSIILAVLGPRAVREMLFPLAYLFFAVPLGEGLIPMLMDFTAAFTVKALALTGVPVFREGLSFTIPSGDFEVAKACSGVRYLFASVALGGLFAYINYRSYWRRAIFIGVAVVLPLIANGIRAYGIVMLAYLSDMKIAVGLDHLIYGWLFFGLIMFLLFFIAAKWREDPAPTGVNQTAANSASNPRFAYWHPLLSVGLIVLLSMGPLAMYSIRATQAANDQNVRLMSPEGASGWRQTEMGFQGWNPIFHGATDQLKQTYVRGGSTVNMYVAYYVRESQDAELISAVNLFFDPKNWTRIQSKTRQIFLPHHKTVRLRQLVIKSGTQRRMIWYWYDIGGTTISDIYLGKLLQAWHRLTGQDRGNAAVVLMLQFGEEHRKGAAATMEAYIQDMYPEIEKQLDRARAGQR